VFAAILRIHSDGGVNLTGCVLAQFELRLQNTYKTNGGYMFDLNVTFENRDTTHRVIVGKEYYEDFDMEPEEVIAMTFAFLLRYKVPRQTEGQHSLGLEKAHSLV